MSASDREEDTADKPHGIMQSDESTLADHGGENLVSSDKDDTTDDELDNVEIPDNDGEVRSLIGVSMGQAQTHMKSAQTPAGEKAQALEQSRGYFGPDQDLDVAEETSQSRDFEKAAEIPGPDTILPTWRSQPEKVRRNTITRALLGGAQAEQRKRASSGPTTILEGLKKMFTDQSTHVENGSSLKQDDRDESTTLSSNDQGTQRQDQVNHPRIPVKSRIRSQLPIGLDGSTSSSEQRISRPNTIRRSTSDNSLYLKRVTTGASDFDDITAFSKIADMPNPRFKAIQDSLADSSIKMPKMPSINFGSPRPTPPRMHSDTARQIDTDNGLSAKGLNAEPSMQIRNAPSTYYATPSDKAQSLLTEALSRTIGDVVIMGGYRGSVLRSAKPPYQQLWVPVKVGLNLRKADLEVGLTREDEERMEDKIIPSGILSHIGPIDIARRLLKKLKKCPNAKAGLLRIHDWGYDWRLSPHLLSQRLIAFLDGLKCNQPDTSPENRGALVIAHSLGGLLTRHAINLRPELFSGVVYAGAPQNCCNILGPLRNGDDVLLSSRVLTAQVNFTLRTSYALLPENGRCFLNKDTGERYDIDFFNVDNWDEYRLSPCINPPLPASAQVRKSMIGSITESISSFTPSLPSKRTSWFSSIPNLWDSSTTTSGSEAVQDKVQETKEDIDSSVDLATKAISSPKHEAQSSLEPSMSSSHHKSSIATTVSIPKDKAREYLTRTLAEVKQFKSELNHIQAHQDANRYPPHAIIFGKAVPTVYGAKVASREAIKCADAFDDIAFAAGDGVVLASAAQLPTGYRCVKDGRVQSDRGHIGLLGDLEGIGRCIEAVVQGRKRGIGSGNYV